MTVTHGVDVGVVLVAVIYAMIMVVIITIGGDGCTGCAANGTADNRTIPAANFIAHSGSKGPTHTTADSRVEGVVSGDTAGWEGSQNHG